MSKSNPWLWVPTLYLAEGIPYIIVNNISTAMFTSMGVSNGQMAFFTSLLYLPWVIKPLWGGFVDIIQTKRWWIIAMQLVMTICFVGLTLSMPHPVMDSAQSTPIGLFTAMLIIFWITAFASATHDIAADGFYMIALNEHDQALFVGIRSTFYRIATILGQGALIFLVGRLSMGMDLAVSWQMGLLTASVLLGACTLWHTRALPCVEKSHTHLSAQETWQDFRHTWVSFFHKKGIGLAILFLLFFRLPEALILKIIYPFLMAPMEDGGLGLNLDTIGIIYSTIGIICLTIGGIIGGWLVARVGIRRVFWWLVIAITIPDMVYVYLAMAQPQQVWWITIALAIEQFGYGFGFTAYMLYMIHVSQGEYPTAHYAICTAFMAISMMLPGIVAGYLEEMMGYTSFFIMTVICCTATFAVALPIRKQFLNT